MYIYARVLYNNYIITIVMMSAIKWIESGIITLQVLIQDPAAFFLFVLFSYRYGSN